MSCCELIVDNTTDIKLTGYRRDSTGEWVNDASPVASVLDANGEAIAGGEAIALAYVPDSDGDYLGTLPATAPIVAGSKYTIHVKDPANGFSDKVTIVAKDRSCC